MSTHPRAGGLCALSGGFIDRKQSHLNPEQLRLLDLGTGANLVYPLIAAHAYGWQCVGVDIDSKALRNAQ